jgi:hypothetical protein
VNWALQATLASPPELPPLLLPELLPELLPLLLPEPLPLLLPELLPLPLLELPVEGDELHADIELRIAEGTRIAAQTARLLTRLFMMAHSLSGATTRSAKHCLTATQGNSLGVFTKADVIGARGES